MKGPELEEYREERFGQALAVGIYPKLSKPRRIVSGGSFYTGKPLTER